MRHATGKRADRFHLLSLSQLMLQRFLPDELADQLVVGLLQLPRALQHALIQLIIQCSKSFVGAALFDDVCGVLGV